MPSSALKPTSIAFFPAAADRSTKSHQQHYLSPPLTPFLHHLSAEDPSQPSKSHSYFPHSLPSLREMLPRERRPDTVPTELETHVFSDSAPEQRSQAPFSETLAATTSTSPQGAATGSDPNRLLPAYPSQSLNGLSSSSAMLSPLLRRNKAHVASACVNCKKAHLACDGMPPLPPLPALPPLTIYDGRIFCAVRSAGPYHGWLGVIRAAAAECGCMSSGQLRTAHSSGFYFVFVWLGNLCVRACCVCVGRGRAPVSGNGMGDCCSR